MSPARKGEVAGRWDLLNPRIWTAIAHAGFGVICFVRPNLDSLFRAYETFGNMPAWGVGMCALALWLLFAPRGSWTLMLGHLTSALVLLTIGTLLTAGVGLLPTAWLAVTLGLVSLLLFARTWQFWLVRQGWFLHLIEHPPGWARRWLHLEHHDG